MDIWMVDIANTDGYACTEGAFISAEYVMNSKEWTFNELEWRKHSKYDEEYPTYYAEQIHNGNITGYTLYPITLYGA
jgi:hypothetical protein